VGRALQHVIDTESIGSRYGKQSADEQWIFLSSKDGDLRCVRTPFLEPRSSIIVLTADNYRISNYSVM